MWSVRLVFCRDRRALLLVTRRLMTCSPSCCFEGIVATVSMVIRGRCNRHLDNVAEQEGKGGVAE